MVTGATVLGLNLAVSSPLADAARATTQGLSKKEMKTDQSSNSIN